MSFLNPVNEPVLRFKSTDAGAPQINQNARVAGDVKAVLKACLVTGYGTTASAGWSIVNEVSHVAEFVSPSVVISDYRLGVDDSSVNTTTWYYQRQNVRVNPSKNSINKKHSSINKSSGENGWQLLVTPQGVCLIEVLYNTLINNLVGRVTYWGGIKSGLIDDNSNNIAFWSAGYTSPALTAQDFFSATDTTYKHYRVGAYGSNVRFSAANLATISRPYQSGIDTISAVEIKSALYLHSDGFFVGEQPAILLKDTNDIQKLYGVYEASSEGRPVVSVCLAWDIADASIIEKSARTILIYTDYWEY